MLGRLFLIFKCKNNPKHPLNILLYHPTLFTTTCLEIFSHCRRSQRRPPLTALEKQQHGINTARQRFNMEKAERAKKERQRLQHEAQKERERKAQQKERDCVNSLFLKSYVDKGCREMVTSVEWELAKWDKATPEDRAKLEQQAETRIAKINKEREERRQRERARERDGGGAYDR